jgi:predicted cupin superfamily sugar epimerase
MTPEEIIETLGMLPHPEGGHYVETWRHAGTDGTRGTGTAIYFLLQAGERSHWHRVDAAEIWHWYAGAPLELSTSADGQAVTITTLGNDLRGLR